MKLKLKSFATHLVGAFPRNAQCLATHLVGAFPRNAPEEASHPFILRISRKCAHTPHSALQAALFCVLVASFSLPLPAMPTREETARAVPVVKQLLASERAALAAGKKTRAEVADAALKLAQEADTEAAKLLLMKGAFVLYVKDGKVEKAAQTMNSIEKSIADLPPQSVTNMIDLALLGLPKKDGERLYRSIDRTRDAQRSLQCARATSRVRKTSGGIRASRGSESVGGYRWSYAIRDGGASVEGVGGMFECAVSPAPEGSIAIPEELGGLPVTRIGPGAFMRCHALTSVTIPSTVTSIGRNAFYECALRTVTIPKGVKDIGELAFYNCRSLKSVTIPEGVTSIGWAAFEDCWRMEKIVIPSSVTNIGRTAVASGSDHMKSIVVSPQNPKYAVWDGLLCTKDGRTVLSAVGGDVTIPDGVTTIAESAFYKCNGLTSVTIPSSVTQIGEAAFEWCDNVDLFVVAADNPKFSAVNGMLCSKDGKTVMAGVNGDVSIPEGVTSITESAFTGRRNLKSVTIPASMEQMGTEVFRCCKGLKSVTMRGERPKGGKGLFDYCEELKAIHVPANALSWKLLKSWQGLPLVFDDVAASNQEKVPASSPRPVAADGEHRETVGGYTWSYRVKNGEAEIVVTGAARCCTITPRPTGRVVIPLMLGGVKVTKIGREALCECGEMTSVEIPASVKEIGWRAFSECRSLTSVTIPKGVTKILPSAFSECHRLTSISVNAENERYAARDGVLFDKRTKTLICYPGGISGPYVVPSDVARIEGNAFTGCRDLTSVTVPDSVASIGEWAFDKCPNLGSVTLGSGVTSIGQGPFYWCSGLKTISVDESNQCYSSLDGVLFDKEKKKLICCPGGFSGAYEIPSSVTTIGQYAFDSCRKLTNVLIPPNVRIISSHAFNYCEGLTSVEIPSNVTTIGDWAFCRAAKSVKISEGVKSIGIGAFCGCQELDAVVIPSSVRSIGNYAFSSCRGLTSVTMLGERPDSKEEVFNKCDKLTAIHVPASAKSWAGMKEWQGRKLVFDARKETAK